jgi:hypothetical protein
MQGPEIPPLSRPPSQSSDRFTSIALKNPLGRRERIAAVTAIRADDLSAFALRGEDRRRKGYELSQFPQILGGGAQQELVFRSARPAQAQSVEPEDALQVSKKHLDLLTLAP